VGIVDTERKAVSEMTENTDILVSGAGVAGPVLAYWLERYGFNPTVVELVPSTRKAGGHAVDLWGSAVDIVERMGILPEVEAARTRNDASSLIRPGKPSIDLNVGELAVEFSDRGVEIPRDELTRLLYQRSRDDVEYVFGDSVAALEEDADGVRVTFQQSAPRRFDLVIGADGLHSAVRRLAFGTEERFRRYLGGYIAVYTIPNFLGLDGRILTHSAVDRTVVVYPVWQSGDARALFMFRRAEEFDYEYHDVEQQKLLLRGVYATDGWEVPRLLEYLEDTEAFYFDSISQIRMDSFSRGRVALVGDAGYAPGAGVGGGTSLAVATAHVLARQLAAAGGDHTAGFRNYEDEIRDTVARSRDIGPALLRTLIPTSRARIWLGMQVARLLPRLPRRLKRTVSFLPREAVQGLRAIATLPMEKSRPKEHL
jgi:2-polyprenyl-6-methoxyphenol hydroxylase-like FAD-dependent oxidoreductase